MSGPTTLERCRMALAEIGVDPQIARPAEGGTVYLPVVGITTETAWMASVTIEWPEATICWPCFAAASMEREVTGGGFRKVEPEIVNELRAIAVLIESHREEFDGLVADFAGGGIVTMAQLRQKRAQSARGAGGV